MSMFDGIFLLVKHAGDNLLLMHANHLLLFVFSSTSITSILLYLPKGTCCDITFYSFFLVKVAKIINI
jgi:hypothetical protein